VDYGGMRGHPLNQIQFLYGQLTMETRTFYFSTVNWEAALPLSEYTIL
jgi:hypothetical protein